MTSTPKVSASMRLPLLTLAAVALAIGARAADPSVRAETPTLMSPLVVDATKTHTLFMGADIAVNLDRDVYPVRNVIGSNWVIEINNSEKEISAKSAPVNLKIVPNLKLAEGEATITGFERKAAYSFANDPSVRLTRGLTNAGTLNADLLAVSANAQHLSDTVNNKALAGAAVLASSDNQFGANALLETAMTAGAIEHFPKAVAGASAPPANSLVSPTLLAGGTGANTVADTTANHAAEQAEDYAASANEPTGRIASQGMDAMEIEFSISSPKPLHEPYLVTMTRFHAQGSKPGNVQSLVYARALSPIDAHLSHVHFTEEGFPFNYELVDFQLHLYDRGVEIATNVASKRVELTRSEAFEYIKMEYVGAHPGATLDAVPALGKFPAQLPVYLHQGKYAGTFFVKVNKDGMPTAPYADAECTRRIDDPFLASVVQGIWFKPALAHGKPVDGVAAVNLGKLAI